MRSLLLVLSLLGFMACGTPTAKCAASNCSGCCDSSGQCSIGSSNAACGSGGALCQPCASSQACTFGQCVTQNTSGGGAGGGSGGGTGGGTVGGGAVAERLAAAPVVPSLVRLRTALAAVTPAGSARAAPPTRSAV